jgi:hypothetical protein
MAYATLPAGISFLGPSFPKSKAPNRAGPSQKKSRLLNHEAESFAEVGRF